MATSDAELVSRKKRRTQSKHYLNKAEKDLLSCIEIIENGEEVSFTRVDHLLETFQTKLKLYDDRQSDYELLLNEDDMTEEIESASVYRDEKISHYLDIQDKLFKFKTSNKTELTSNDGHNNNVIQATLPKLELPLFKGDVCEWQSFWDKFSAIIDKRSDLSNVNKFSYLQSLLRDEAKSCLQGLALTESNYETAKELLRMRFGRKEKIVVTHIQKLLYISSRNNNDLWKLYDEVQIHVRSLANLDIKGDNYGLVLTPLILHQLPTEIRMEWARQSEGKEGDLDHLLSFLYSEIQRRERSQTFDKGKLQSLDSVCTNRKEKRFHGTTSALLNVDTRKRSCVFCSGDHYADKCPEILPLDHVQRKDKIKTMNLCFRCLARTHKADRCDKKCFHCKGNHHCVLHLNKSSGNTRGGSNSSTVEQTTRRKGMDVLLPCNDNANNVSPPVANSSVMYHNQSAGQNTLMQCVKVPIGGHDVFILFDSGSDRSYIKSGTAKKLCLMPQGKESLSFHSFAASKGQRECPLFELSMGGLNLTLLGIDNICQPMLRSKVPENMLKDFRGIPVYEQLDRDNLIKVDILIGLDYYWSMIDGNVTHISEGLVAQQTKVGWMISGSYSSSNQNVKIIHSLFCMQEPSEAIVKQCWELDAIGIKGEDSSELVGSGVLDQFCKGVSLVENRYRVGLPWKSDDHRDMLVNNVNSAQKRLVSLNKRLDSNPELKNSYNKVFTDLEQQNMIEEVPAVRAEEASETDTPIYYLPHRPVVREDSLSTKVRPVFDASAKGANGVSLNDCMNTGPNLIPDLTGILLRFRRWRFGLTADIQKAFLQIELQEADRDVHRFLLLTPDNQIRHMRFTRVTFGNASSPFLLNATLKLHLSKQRENRTIKELRDNLYVDDWLTGSDDEDNLAVMMREADQVMKQGSFHLTKWASNSDKVRDNVGKTLLEDSDFVSQKILGVGWDPHSDSFHFKFLSGTCGVLLSKRTLLGMIARIFDPLGFLNPFTITLKIMFQEAWKDGHEWDAILPEDMQQELECWVSSLRIISQWKIPRRLSCKDWSCLEKIELVVFADASQRAYGSCVYLKSTVNDHVDVSLVISKVRVAPLKEVTLPRLELLAALLAARLLHFVKVALQLPEDISYVCFTDSMIALGWIQGEPFKWKQFVRNRVSEIKQLTDSTKWNHCPGKLNPADLLTRGVSASVLTSSQWLKGPEWLLSPSYCFVDEAGPEANDLMSNCELEQNEPSCAIVSDETPLIDFDRFSSFDKLLRVVSNVLKFVKRLRRLKDVSDFYSLVEAKTVLFTLLQKKHYDRDIEELKRSGVVKKGSSLVNLCPFIGEDGLLRVKGRLGHAQSLSYDEKHPIILPKSYVSFLLVKSQHIALKHAGVKLLITSLRNKYWIVSVRPLAKKVVRLCLDCQRHDSRLLDQCVAPLPEARLTQSPPFAVVGIDYAGPLFCSDVPGTKLYILLFTCAVTRAVHLELLDSMTADDFLLAFKRFVSRRAMPTIVYSDNAQTFKRAQTLLHEHLGHEMFKWQNQPALSPWWGGFYERMVRCVKSSLRKTIGKKSIPKKELETVLVEIEACVNSRPLTHISDNDTYLTPSHFLVGRGCPLSALELINLNQVIDLPALYEYHRSLLDEFWETWRAEYLRALPPLSGKQANTRLKVGSIVLIHDENKRRMFWDLGLVVKVFKGLDGMVRAAKVKTKRNCIVRSVQRLVLLEVDQDDDFVSKSPLQTLENLDLSETDKAGNPAAISALVPSHSRDPQNPIPHRVSRSGRLIKSPKLFTL